MGRGLAFLYCLLACEALAPPTTTRVPRSRPRQHESIGLATATAAFLISLQPVEAAELRAGAEIFTAECAGCHAGGGNIIGYARGKTLKVGCPSCAIRGTY